MSPIDCEQVLSQIEVYLDGELEGAVCGDIREHLQDCGPCTDRAEFLRRLQELIAARCACQEVPPDLMERIQALIRDPGAT